MFRTSRICQYFFPERWVDESHIKSTYTPLKVVNPACPANSETPSCRVMEPMLLLYDVVASPCDTKKWL